MKQSRREFLRLMLSSSAVLITPQLLAGCVAPAPGSPTTTDVATSVTAPVELQVWTKIYQPISADLWREAMDTIAQDLPNIKINLLQQTWSNEDEQKLITAMASGTGPDLWSHGGSSGGFWGAKNVAAPLDDMLAASPLANEYVDAALFPHRWNGRLHALPFGVSPRFMVWRRDIFEEVGLDPDSGPADWTELGEMGQQLAVWEGNDIKRIGFGIPPQGAHFYFGLFMHQLGGSWFNEDFSETRINDPAGVQALQFVVDLFHTYRVNATYALQPEVAGAPLLATGQSAMDWTSVAVHYYVKANRPDLVAQFGYGMPPASPQGGGTIIFADTFLINQVSSFKEQAWSVIERLQAYDTLEQVSLPQGFLVPRRSWYEKFPEKVAEDAVISVGLDALNNAFSIHWGPQWTPFRIAMIPFIDEAILQRRSPQEALDAAAEKLNTEILAAA